MFVLPSAALAVLTFDENVNDRTCTLDASKTITTCTLTFPTASGGTGDVTYSMGFTHEATVSPGFVFEFARDTRVLTVNGQRRYQTKDGWAFTYKAQDDDDTITTDFTVKIDGTPLVEVPTAGLNLTVGEAVDKKLFTAGNGQLVLAIEEVKGWNRPASERGTEAEFNSVDDLAFAIDNTRPAAAPYQAATTIKGTPTQPGEFEVKLKLTDGDNQEKTQATLRIFVNGKPSFGDARIPNTVFAIGKTGVIAVPEPTLGNGAWGDHRFEIASCSVPIWLGYEAFDPKNIRLSGRPDASDRLDATTCEATLTDAPVGDQTKGDPATIKFCFSVGEGTRCGVNFDDAGVPNQVWSVGAGITPLTLPKPRATGAVSYSVSGLPAGVVFNEATRTLSGAPTEHGKFTATYTATDTAGTSVKLDIRITVDGDPSFSETRVATTVFEIGKEGEIDLPEATPGNGAWDLHQFTFSPAKPSWLRLERDDPLELRLIGAPPEGTPNTDAQIYTLTLADVPVSEEDTANTATLKFCFSVGTGAPCAGVSFDDDLLILEYTGGYPITAETLPEAQFGTGELTYSIADLRPGLVFDPDTRRLSGTPPFAGDRSTVTAIYKVTDEANDDDDTMEIRIIVNRSVTYGGFRLDEFEFDFTVGARITTVTLPGTSGGTGTLTYSLSCAATSPTPCDGLPADLSFHTGSLELSGTPAEAGIGAFLLLLEATDSLGASASLPVPVRVHPAPSFEDAAVELEFPGPAQTLPAAQGGSGALTYALVCTSDSPTSCTSLPPGVAFDNDTRTVSANAFTTPGDYTLELSATDGNDATAKMQVNLTVAGIVVKAYASQTEQTAGNPGGDALSDDGAIKVVEGNTDKDSARRYTLALAVKPSAAVTITLADPDEDDDLQYWEGQAKSFPFTAADFDTAGNFVGTPGTVILKAEEDDDGVNGRASIRHTVTSDDPAYNGITFYVDLVEVEKDPRVELRLSPTSLNENENAEETTVTVSALVFAPGSDSSLGSFNSETEITLKVAEESTAQTGADFTAKELSSFSILSRANNGVSTFKLTPKQDDVYEGDETVIVSGAADPEGRTPSPATLTIEDDDPPPLSADCGEPVLEPGEGGTAGVICTVMQHDGEGNPVVADTELRVSYSLESKTATAGADYEDVGGSVFIKAGKSSGSIVITVYGDDETEGRDTFGITFSARGLSAATDIIILEGDGGSGQQQRAPSGGQSQTEEGPTDAYRATVAFGETAYTVTEGEAATTIRVTLDPAPPEDIAIPIPIAGKGGPGVTAEDWRFAVGEGTNDTWNAASRTATVQFAAGQTERTINLEALDDEEIEGDETLTLRFNANRLPAGVTVDPEAAEAVVTLVDDDLADLRGRALEHVLAAFGRTVATDAVTLLTGRMADDAPDTGARLTLGGRTFTLRSLSGSTEPDGTGTREDTAAPAFNAVNAFDPLNPPDPRGPPVTAGQSISLRQLLNGASFRYRHGDPEDGLLTLWGQGGTARFEGGSGTDFSLDGEATSGWLGLDWRQHGTVAGLSLAQYRGDVGYDFAGNQDAGGDVDLELTSLFPYARLSLDNGLDLWGIAGFGKGNLTLTDGFGGNSTDLSMQMAAAGLRRALTPLGGGVTLAAKADGFLVRMASEARGRDTAAFADDLPSVDAAAQRLRLALEAGYTHTLASGAVLRPTAELGARYDGGDAETGAGLDLAGGLRYQSPSRRLLVEGRGRVLLVHAASQFREWAASGLVRLTPETGGQGLSFSLQPAWGMTPTGPDALWNNAALPNTATTPRGRVTAELGYGLPAFGGRGLLTPYAGADLAQGTGRTYRVGVRSLLNANATLSLEGARRETGQGEPDTRIGLQVSFVF